MVSVQRFNFYTLIEFMAEVEYCSFKMKPVGFDVEYKRVHLLLDVYVCNSVLCGLRVCDVHPYDHDVDSRHSPIDMIRKGNWKMERIKKNEAERQQVCIMRVRNAT